MTWPCQMCAGTGQRFRQVPGGYVSDLVACWCCAGSGEHDHPVGRDLTVEPDPPAQASLFGEQVA